jgi:hypothetical protein
MAAVGSTAFRHTPQAVDVLDSLRGSWYRDGRLEISAMGGEIEVRDAPWAEVGRGFKCAEQGRPGIWVWRRRVSNYPNWARQSRSGRLRA